MQEWIDQNLCTGDGLCRDHCVELLVLLEDGISHMRDPATGRVDHDPGGCASLVPVPSGYERAVIHAVDDRPGECIFLEPGGAS